MLKNIPNSVSEIGRYAFQDCKGLTSITISGTVKKIKESAFIGCTGLTSVFITDLASWCNINFVPSKYNYDDKCR